MYDITIIQHRNDDPRFAQHLEFRRVALERHAELIAERQAVKAARRAARTARRLGVTVEALVAHLG